MRKARRAHLWIGLIASVFIFVEALTGLLMNEPWLVGQSQVEGMRGNFQLGQSNQFRNNQGFDNGQAGGQDQNGFNSNRQWQGQNGFNGSGQFQRRFNGNFDPSQIRQSQGIMGTIRSLHEGRLGNINVKWFLDMVAIAMMVLTGTGIYLSAMVLGTERKRKNKQDIGVL